MEKKTFASHVSSQGLVSGIYKQYTGKDNGLLILCDCSQRNRAII